VSESAVRPAADVFAVLSEARRVWAVAAVHGEAARLAALHRALEPRFLHGDRLVYCGNLIGQGPDSAGAIDEALRLRRRLLARPGMEAADFAFLRGGQEEMFQKLLTLHYAVNPPEVFDWMARQGVNATLASYGESAETLRHTFRLGAQSIARWTVAMRERIRAHPGHEEFFGALRRAAFTADRKLLFVNAGIDGARPLDSQGDAFWWGGTGFNALEAPFESFRLLVRGYDRGRGGVAVGNFKASLDGGCGFGGALNAACFVSTGEAVEWIEA